MCRHVTIQDWKHAHEEKHLNLVSDDRREAYWKAIEARRSGYIGRHTELFSQLLSTLMRRVQSAARGTVFEEQIPNAVEDVLRDHDQEYRTQVETLYAGVWPAFADSVREALQGESSRHVDWMRKAQKQDEGFWQREARAYVSNNGGILIQEPVSTTKNAIMAATRQAVDDGLSEGWGSERIAREIDSNTGQVVSRHRARRIARTETIRASNRATVSGAQRTVQETGMRLEKEWIATMDQRVRPAHAAADGQTVPLNSSFTVAGFPAKYPGDPSLPPGQSIYCRCTVAFSTKPAPTGEAPGTTIIPPPVAPSDEDDE